MVSLWKTEGEPVSIVREGRISGAKLWAPFLAATVLVVGTGAVAAAAGATDELTEFDLAVGCSNYDSKTVNLTFHVESDSGTPSSGRITDVAGTITGELGAYSYGFQYALPDGVEYFGTGDFDIPLSDLALASVVDGETFAATVSYANGDVAASGSVTVNCHVDATPGATPHDVAVKARLGVPRAFNLLEHVTFGDFGVGGYVSRAWVAGPGATVDAVAAAADVLDLDTATGTALGASLSDQTLTVDATTAGTYSLDWGVVMTDVTWTSVPITEDPQDVYFPFTQETYLQFEGWDYSGPVVCWPEFPEEGSCGPIPVYRESIIETIQGGTTHTFVGKRIPWVSVKTAETNVAYGPAPLTIEVIDGPITPDPSEIVEGSRGDVQVPATVKAGDELTVDVGDENAGGYVDVWLNSTPVYLGLFPVAANGTVGVTVPANFVAGAHRVVVTDEVGTFVGWDNLNVSAAGNNVPKGATGLDEGQRASWGGGLAASGMLALVGVAYAVARRTRSMS